MNKLLQNNFYSLFKAKYFRITLVISILLGAFFTVAVYLYPNVNLPSESSNIVIDKEHILNIVPSFGVIILPFASAATVGLFLDAEYKQGTIRNKIICGFRRTEIFFSQLLTLCLAQILYFVLFESAVFAIAIIAFGYTFELKAVIISLAAMLISLIAVSTILSLMIGSFVQGGKLIVILLVTQYALNVFLVIEMFKQDNELLDMVSRAVPQGFMLEFNYTAVPEKIWLNFALSAALIIVLSICGVSKLNRSDLK